MSLQRSSYPVLASLLCAVLAACTGVAPVDDLGPGDGPGFDAGTLAQAGAGGGTEVVVDAGPPPDLGGALQDAGDSATVLPADGGGDAGATDRPDGAVEPPRPRCLTKGSQVVLLGDSYINWVSHTFPADLNKEANQTYRMYAVGAFSMGSGGLGFIPPQLDMAVADDPDIVAIVMTGGGNDVLVADTTQFPQGGDCKMSQMSPMIPDCQKIVAKAIDAADEMMNNGIAHGIHEVVYFFYPNVPDGTIVGGTHPNAILEYAAPLVKAFCDESFERTGGGATCHFVDLRPVFKGHPEYFAPTDIHPNLAGSAAMARAVWQKMKDECIAQPPSSGCCEP